MARRETLISKYIEPALHIGKAGGPKSARQMIVEEAILTHVEKLAANFKVRIGELDDLFSD